jgi:hypothetical protein
VIAEREFLHPLQDEQLDLGNLLQVDERRVALRGALVPVPGRMDRRPAIPDHA